MASLLGSGIPAFADVTAEGRVFQEDTNWIAEMGGGQMPAAMPDSHHADSSCNDPSGGECCSGAEKCDGCADGHCSCDSCGSKHQASPSDLKDLAWGIQSSSHADDGFWLRANATYIASAGSSGDPHAVAGMMDAMFSCEDGVSCSQAYGPELPGGPPDTLPIPPPFLTDPDPTSPDFKAGEGWFELEGCDCYTWVTVSGRLCTYHTRCYGPTCTFSYRATHQICWWEEGPWWSRLPPCPETLDLAWAAPLGGALLIEGERWGKDCGNPLHEDVNCIRNVTRQGPGQQCCYDGNGNLVKEGPSAGTPDKIATCNFVGNDGCCQATARPGAIDNRFPTNLYWHTRYDKVLQYMTDWYAYKYGFGKVKIDARKAIDDYLKEYPPYGSLEYKKGTSKSLGPGAWPETAPWPTFPPVKKKW